MHTNFCPVVCQGLHKIPISFEFSVLIRSQECCSLCQYWIPDVGQRCSWTRSTSTVWKLKIKSSRLLGSWNASLQGNRHSPTGSRSLAAYLSCHLCSVTVMACVRCVALLQLYFFFLSKESVCQKWKSQCWDWKRFTHCHEASHQLCIYHTHTHTQTWAYTVGRVLSESGLCVTLHYGCHRID